MKIFINNESLETNSALLSSVLKEQSFLEKKGIAVALNNSVIAKSNWDQTKINENDNILIITATQGG